MNNIPGHTTVIPTDGEMVFVAMNGESVRHNAGTVDTVYGIKVTSWTYKGWLFCRSEGGHNIALRSDIDSGREYPFNREHTNEQ